MGDRVYASKSPTTVISLCAVSLPAAARICSKLTDPNTTPPGTLQPRPVWGNTLIHQTRLPLPVIKHNPIPLGGCYRSGAVLAGSIWRTFPFWRSSQSGASWAPIWRAQSGESLADLAGILEAGNCVAQPFWRDAQSGERFFPGHLLPGTKSPC